MKEMIDLSLYIRCCINGDSDDTICLLLFLSVTTEEPPLSWKHEPGNLWFVLGQQGSCMLDDDVNTEPVFCSKTHFIGLPNSRT